MSHGSRGWRSHLVLSVLLVLLVVLDWLHWLGWRRPELRLSETDTADPYSAGEVLGLVVSVAVLVAIMAVVTGRARLFAHVAFMALVCVSYADLGMVLRPDGNDWPIVFVIYGPLVYVVLYAPALAHDQARRRSQRAIAEAEAASSPPARPTTDQQVAVWREHRRRMVGG